MALSEEQIDAVYERVVRKLCRQHVDIDIERSDFRAAISGVSGYLDDNAVAMNQSIPQPARGALSVADKALILKEVTEEQYGGS